jgi:hypothetical protein
VNKTVRNCAFAAALLAGVTGAACAEVAIAGAAGAGVPSCTGGQLAVHRSAVDGAAGHSVVILRFVNVGSSSCSLYGYPGLDALDAHGSVLKSAARSLTGITGSYTEHAVVVNPGSRASAAVEWQNFSDGGGACRYSASIATTPPNTTKIVHFGVSVSVCSLKVHPVVPGGSGLPG